MSKRSSAIVFAAALVLWMLVMPSSLYPCGPYFRVPVFVSSEPESAERYVNGELGILRSTYSRTNLFVAWRVLNGRPLSATERASLEPKPPRTGAQFPPSASQIWERARDRITLGGESLYANQRELKDYQFFVNCNDDAFITAANALKARIEKYGISSSEVKEWTVAQNMVFSNCSAGSAIPLDLSDSAPAQLRADREYQIAAANFYATNYDEAARLFAAIARDTGSQWRNYGLFLSARAYIRMATVGPLLEKKQPLDERAALRRAKDILQQVTGDSGLKDLHASARRLLSFVAYRLEPQEQAELLGAKLQKPRNDEEFQQELTDYFRLTRSYRGKDDEMADWIQTVSASDAQASLLRWKQEPKSLTWLVAALMSVPGNTPESGDLIQAAMRVPTSSPAYLTAQYYSAKLRLEKSDLAAARSQIDGVLKSNSARMPLSAYNAFRILRAQAAANLADFANFTVLQPVATSWGDEPDSRGDQPCATDSNCPKKMVSAPVAEMINHLPLSLLVRLAQDEKADFVLRRGSAIVGWERGVMLGNFTLADTAARVLAALGKQDAQDLSEYLAAKTQEEKRVAAAIVMLKWPGAQPLFISDEIRDDPMRTIDNYRRNWWCARSVSTAQVPKNTPRFPAFLGVEERKAAEREGERMAELGNAPNYLGGVVTSYAKAHIKDPRMPEALHLVVRATRYGCTDSEIVRFSKQAFELLHKNYPNNEWTKKTPYYFKD